MSGTKILASNSSTTGTNSAAYEKRQQGANTGTKQIV